jgi:cytidine diphosphoramidate kinase
MIVWVIGMSGVGKTAIGRELYKYWKQKNPATVLIDGDEIREIFKNDNHAGDYSLEGRRMNAERIREMCLWLDKQGIDVICCILSIFEENHLWNRENYSQYFEVFVDAPFDELVARNPKNLYRQAQQGIIKNVVGVDIAFNKPVSPDMSIMNSQPYRQPSYIAIEIAKSLQEKFEIPDRAPLKAILGNDEN